jgi:hypothetical protein
MTLTLYNDGLYLILLLIFIIQSWLYLWIETTCNFPCSEWGFGGTSMNAEQTACGGESWI